MENTSLFFENLKNGMGKGINVAILGKIDKFDAKKMKADVVPLFPDYPMLIELPVMLFNGGGFNIRPVYKKGDLVVVLFFDKDIDNSIMSGNSKPLNSTRTHALEDGIVIGGVNSFNNTVEIKAKDDSLAIGSDETVIEIGKDSTIKVKAKEITMEAKDVNVKGNLNVQTINNGPYPPL